MQRLTQPLAEHHGHCDDVFAAAENAALDGNWAEAARQFDDFRNQMEAHFRAEESVLFPCFENATGNPYGPTEVMRSEHRHMREMMDAMDAAIRNADGDSYAGLSETLLIMMQQHNHKEEGILYPMCDSALGSDSGALAAQLAKEIASAS
jgi:iron-sulfur cluster repair protein YtfE (RIC family)